MIIRDLSLFCYGFHCQHVPNELFLIVIIFLEKRSEYCTRLFEEQIEIVAIDVVSKGMVENILNLLALFC